MESADDGCCGKVCSGEGNPLPTGEVKKKHSMHYYMYALLFENPLITSNICTCAFDFSEPEIVIKSDELQHYNTNHAACEGDMATPQKTEVVATPMQISGLLTTHC